MAQLDAEAFTDGACVCLVDRAALPDDVLRGPCDLPALQAAEQAGVLRVWPLDSDGSYAIRAFVGEPIPDALRRYAEPPWIEAELPVPSGELLFVGAEHVKHPSERALAAGRMSVPPGRYRLGIAWTAYPDEEDLARFEASVPEHAYRLHQRIEGLTALAVAGVIGGLVLGAISVAIPELRPWWPFWGAPVAALVLAVIVLRRRATFRRANATYVAIQREMPAVIAELERLDDAGPHEHGSSSDGARTISTRAFGSRGTRALRRDEPRERSR